MASSGRLFPHALLLLALAGAATVLADEPAPPVLGFDLVFGDDPGGKLPTDLAWAPGGVVLGYVWDDGEGKALWALDVARGERRLLLREGGPMEIELDAYHWTPAGGGVLIESAGDLFLLSAAGGLSRLTETAAEESDPKLSPDGGQVAFVREHDLWLLYLASGEERALTTDGAEGELLNGVTDWVYWEEIWGRDSTGHWWAPDGRRIAYYRFDESPVGRYPLVDFTAVPYPTVAWQRYPKAGTANPIVRVGALDLASGATVWLETGDPAVYYLARVDWHPDGDLLVQRLDRDQTRLELLRCDPAGGACSVLCRDEWPTWVNLTTGMHRFAPDGRFLAPSEKSGWRRLYLYAADGSELRPVTPEGWSVTSLDAVDWREGRLVFTAYPGGGLGAKDRRVFRGSLAGGESPAPVSSAEGWSAATVAADSGNLVLTRSTADSPATQTVLDPGGRELAELPSTPPPYDPAALPAWRFLTLPGPDGAALPAALLEPAGRRPGRRHPVIMYHYGGPASQVVADRWDRRGRSLWHKMMAERGFGVLLVDNLGSSFFGKAGEDRLHRRFGEVNLAAQLAGLDYLAGLDWVDPERVGLWGWSGGGANTLYSILKSPGRWAAAVSGAPVTDWRLYDTIWTERYLDHPDDNPDGYRDSSAVTWAGELATPLLVVHGTGDDNVHPQNTLALVHRLVEAGAPVETAIYPRQKHGFEGAASRHFYERMTEFFERRLAEPASARP